MDEIARAVDIVARHAIAAAAEVEVGIEVGWDNYPEVGEHDWTAVAERVDEIRRSLDPPHESFLAAYKLLESRCGP